MPPLPDQVMRNCKTAILDRLPENWAPATDSLPPKKSKAPESIRKWRDWGKQLVENAIAFAASDEALKKLSKGQR